MSCTLKSVLLAFYLSLDLAMGASLQTEVLVWKPWASISADLSRLPLKLEYRLQPGPLSVNSWNLNVPELTVLASTDALEYQVSDKSILNKTDKLSVTIQIPLISVDQTIEQIVAGNVIRVRVVSQCSAVSITNSGIHLTSNMNWNWINNFPSPVLSDLQIDWTENSWMISDFQCSGPLGINSIFISQIKAGLGDRRFIQSLIFEKIKSAVLGQWSSAKDSLFSGINSKVKLDGIAVWNAKGAGLLGTLTTDVNQEVAALEKQVLNKSEFTTMNFDKQKIIVPKILITSMAKQTIQSTPIKTMNIRENEGFMGLLRSRFLQFFLWPDLLNFRKDSRFEVSFKSFYNVVVQWTSKKTAQISGNLNATFDAEREKKFAPYLDLAFGFSVNADITKSAQDIDISAKSPSIDFKYRFESIYLKKFNSSQRISGIIIKKAKVALESAIKIDVRYSLKSLLEDSFSVEDYEVGGDSVILDYQNENLTNAR